MTNKKLADQGSVALGLISSTHSFLMTFKIHVCTSSIQFAVTDMERDSPGSCNKYLYGSSRIRSEAAWVSLSIASSVHKSLVEDKEQKKVRKNKRPSFLNINEQPRVFIFCAIQPLQPFMKKGQNTKICGRKINLFKLSCN